MENFLTVGQIAQQVNIPIWKCQYLLRSRDIKEIGRAGNMRMFSPNVVGVLRSELNSIEAKRKQTVA
jgi:hypothetical protein